MSILNRERQPDKWRDKYFDLLDENERIEKQNQAQEDLLCKTIVRLTVAAEGFNKDLDPHLLAIRKQLKSGLKSEQLKAELEKFSTAVMFINESENIVKSSVGLLFDFLYFHFPEQKKQFQQIELKVEKNCFSNPEYLFAEIDDAIESIQTISPVESTDIELGDIDTEALKSVLYRLLEETEIPDRFADQAQELKEKLEGKLSVAVLLDEIISLLLQVKKHFQSEQQEMAMFLADLTIQLNELGEKTSETYLSSRKTDEKRNLLDQSFSIQMTELQNNSDKATELEPLKKLVRSRLNTISQQIQAHLKQEKLERGQINQKFKFLVRKVKTMEKESRQLKTQLDYAYKKATHDALTGLPNRLAYNKRLNSEIARLKRYQTPLSLIIWDIDFFKKINDTFGHKAGDKTLILIAKILVQHCRDTDFVSRFGGEEFTMLLANTEVQAAFKMADQLRQSIERAAFHSNGKKIDITVSCGITQFTTDDTHESAFLRADKALYQAKEQGRNRCIIYSS